MQQNAAYNPMSPCVDDEIQVRLLAGQTCPKIQPAALSRQHAMTKKDTELLPNHRPYGWAD